MMQTMYGGNRGAAPPSREYEDTTFPLILDGIFLAGLDIADTDAAVLPTAAVPADQEIDDYPAQTYVGLPVLTGVSIEGQPGPLSTPILPPLLAVLPLVSTVGTGGGSAFVPADAQCLPASRRLSPATSMLRAAPQLAGAPVEVGGSGGRRRVIPILGAGRPSLLSARPGPIPTTFPCPGVASARATGAGGLEHRPARLAVWPAPADLPTRQGSGERRWV